MRLNKKNISSLLGLLIIFASCNKGKPFKLRSDLDIAELKGKVKSLTTRTYSSDYIINIGEKYPDYISSDYIPKKSLYSTTIDIYNENGNLLSKEITFSDKTINSNYEYLINQDSIIITEYECISNPSCDKISSIRTLVFNKEGDIIEEIIQSYPSFAFKSNSMNNSKTEHRNRICYFYNGNNKYDKIIETFTAIRIANSTGAIDTSRAVITPTLYKYYSDGTLKEIESYIFTSSVKHEVKRFNTKGVITDKIETKMYLLDSKETIFDFTNSKLYKPDEFTFNKELYEYNDKGQLENKLKLDEKGKITDKSKFHYLYNDSNSIIDKTESKNGGIVEHAKVVYDKYVYIEGLYNKEIDLFLINNHLEYDNRNNVIKSVAQSDEFKIKEDGLGNRYYEFLFTIKEKEIEYHQD